MPAIVSVHEKSLTFACFRGLIDHGEKKLETQRIFTGRFFREPLQQFLKALNLAAVESRRLTQSEKAIRKVQYSLDNDFRDGFAPREHKLDAYSLAGRELAKLETAKADDLKEAEIVQVRAQLAAVERLQNQLASRLLELDNSRGSTIYLERQRMIREAMAKTG